MNMTESSNFAEAMRRIGLNDTQIVDLVLAIEGRISLDEMEKRYNAAKGDNEKKCARIL